MIELKGVEKLYGRKNAKNRRGLFATDLTIPDGQIVGLLGENGAGKSTLLRAVAGLNPLTAGSVLLDGRPPKACYQELSFITGEGSYFPEMTPRCYGEYLGDFFTGFDAVRYGKLLDFFEVDAAQPIKKMSTGQRSKVEVAAGFAKHARYILMDEPFLGKDMFTRRDFLKLMASSLHGRETILLTTHHVDEIEQFIDRAVILHGGRVAADCGMDTLLAGGSTLVELMQKATGYDPQKYQLLFEDFASEAAAAAEREADNVD